MSPSDNYTTYGIDQSHMHHPQLTFFGFIDTLHVWFHWQQFIFRCSNYVPIS